MGPAGVNLSNAYMHFGRHTEAGRMIFALYSAEQNRHAYKPEIRMRTASVSIDPHEQHLMSLKAPPKVTVKVPRPIKRHIKQCPRFPMHGGRKTAGDIKKDTKKMFSKEANPLPMNRPQKSRKDLIQELQRKFSGEPEEQPLSKLWRDRHEGAAKRSIGNDMLVQLREEISERKQFLKEMQKLNEKMYADIAPGIWVEIRQREKDIAACMASRSATLMQ